MKEDTNPGVSTFPHTYTFPENTDDRKGMDVDQQCSLPTYLILAEAPPPTFPASGKPRYISSDCSRSNLEENFQTWLSVSFNLPSRSSCSARGEFPDMLIVDTHSVRISHQPAHTMWLGRQADHLVKVHDGLQVSQRTIPQRQAERSPSACPQGLLIKRIAASCSQQRASLVTAS